MCDNREGEPDLEALCYTLKWRWARDSNPGRLSPQRFSRPPLSTTQPFLLRPEPPFYSVFFIRSIRNSQGPEFLETGGFPHLTVLDMIPTEKIRHGHLTARFFPIQRTNRGQPLSQPGTGGGLVLDRTIVLGWMCLLEPETFDLIGSI